VDPSEKLGAHRRLDNGLLDCRRGFDWGAEPVKHCQSRSVMIADVANSLVAQMADRRDPSDAVPREEESGPIIEQIEQHINMGCLLSSVIWKTTQ
jgi:hypothetical protein